MDLISATRTWGSCLGFLAFLGVSPTQAAPPGVSDGSATARHRADQAFERLDQAVSRSPALQTANSPAAPGRSNAYPSDQYLVGTGQGELSKGRVTCQRVAELAARTDLAKQIRVLVKERAVDRIRERTGHHAEQDLEVTREEIVQEYLQGVKIVDRHVDEATGICSSTAVMPRASLPPNAEPNGRGSDLVSPP